MFNLYLHNVQEIREALDSLGVDFRNNEVKRDLVNFLHHKYKQNTSVSDIITELQMIKEKEESSSNRHFGIRSSLFNSSILAYNLK